MRQPQTKSVTRAVLGAILLSCTGCLGPNPLYGIGQTALNSTIMTFVSTFWSNLLSGS